MSRTSTRAFAALAIGALSACDAKQERQEFPDLQRDAAPIVSTTYSTEDARDRAGEVAAVARLAGIRPGMSVADIGTGEGYYTVRLSPLVGPKGRVLAQDISAEALERLSQRVQRERLDNVTMKLGRPADPMLPANSFDRIFLVHMYHEVAQPYEFLWHLRDGLKPGGLVIVVDSDRPVRRHGMPPAQLRCEMAAVGLQQVQFTSMDGLDAYLSAFRITGPKPSPQEIEPCRPQNRT